ncbi:MAG: S9 family peptidase [Proteobacteria bacterium]|nr:S9 family peptidase [Pseudomonadota bacterium]
MRIPHEPIIDDMHGRQIVDPHRALEDENDPDVIAWTREQGALTRAVLDAVPQRAAIRERLRELLRIGWVGVPRVRGHRYFMERREGEQNQPVLHVRDGLQGEERVLLDPNAWSSDGTIALDWWVVSNDGRRMAYGVSKGGDERSTLHVLEVDSGETLGDVIPGTRACSLAWLEDGSGFYYTRYPAEGEVPSGEEGYHRRIFLHRLGEDPAGDRLVFGEGRAREHWPNVDLSDDGRWMLVSVEVGWTRTDLYLFDRVAQTPPVVISEGVDVLFGAEIVGDVLFLLTNDGAPRYRLYRVDLEAGSAGDRGAWREIIAEHETRVLSGFMVVGGQLIVHWMERASSRLTVHDLDGRHIDEIALPTLGTVSGMSGEHDGDELFFGFSSFTVPPTVYRCAVSDRVEAPARHLSVEADLDPARYAVNQVTYPSRDGTPITMFVVHRADLSLDGTSPCVLTGYGGFNVSMTPGFTRSTYVWLERGGVYAIPNLRGGGEYGEAWHRAGMLESKQNVFDDFIAAAEFLIASGYTRSERLAISGGSNGGLLVGAAMTQRPALFRAVVCSVPLLDMLRYHLFRIARLWIPEYGCAEDPEQFEWLVSYSPYHNVTDGVAYPATLLLTGASDSRVDPLHARKMAARLKEATSGGPVLLRVESDAGHGAGKPLAKVLDEGTDTWSFVFSQLGVR